MYTGKIVPTCLKKHYPPQSVPIFPVISSTHLNGLKWNGMVYLLFDYHVNDGFVISALSFPISRPMAMTT